MSNVLESKNKTNSYRSAFWHQFTRNKIAVICSIYLVLVFLAVIIAPEVLPYKYDEMVMEDSLVAPNAKHWLGTDESGRDMLTRIIYGGRISLMVGIVSTGITLLIGLPLGLIAGFYGGKLQFVIMRIMDMLQTFPNILLALVVIAILGRGTYQVMIAVGVANIAAFTRVVNSAVISCKESEYLTAARCLGAKDSRLMFRHIFPNITAQVIVMATLYIASGLLAASSLSFLGLGAQPPSPEWGSLISRGRQQIRQATWLVNYPGIMIVSVVVSFNMIGDALRDALDPFVRNR